MPRRYLARQLHDIRTGRILEKPQHVLVVSAFDYDTCQLERSRLEAQVEALQAELERVRVQTGRESA